MGGRQRGRWWAVVAAAVTATLAGSRAGVTAAPPDAPPAGDIGPRSEPAQPGPATADLVALLAVAAYASRRRRRRVTHC